MKPAVWLMWSTPQSRNGRFKGHTQDHALLVPELWPSQDGTDLSLYLDCTRAAALRVPAGTYLHSHEMDGHWVYRYSGA